MIHPVGAPRLSAFPPQALIQDQQTHTRNHGHADKIQHDTGPRHILDAYQAATINDGVGRAGNSQRFIDASQLGLK